MTFCNEISITANGPSPTNANITYAGHPLMAEQAIIHMNPDGLICAEVRLVVSQLDLRNIAGQLTVFFHDRQWLLIDPAKITYNDVPAATILVNRAMVGPTVEAIVEVLVEHGLLADHDVLRDRAVSLLTDLLDGVVG